jgi:hypothetical protein
MRVFISWSEGRAKHVASALRDWLPMVVQGAEPWMSDIDLHAGQRWFEVIGDQLSATDFAVVVVTPESQSRPWTMFESGAVAKATDRARVVPYLIGIRPSDLPPPLGLFQAVEATPEGTLKLLASICDAIGPSAPKREKLAILHERMWPVLETSLNSVPKSTTASMHRTERELLEEVLSLVRSAPTARPSEKHPEQVKLQGAEASGWARGMAESRGLIVRDIQTAWGPMRIWVRLDQEPPSVGELPSTYGTYRIVWSRAGDPDPDKVPRSAEGSSTK